MDDSHSVKRPRTMPPEVRCTDLTPSAHHSKPDPTATSPYHHLHTSDAQHHHHRHYPRLTVNTTTIGLNASSANRSLLSLPGATGGQVANGTPLRREPHSVQHSKDTLFHKDTHHRHLPKQEQAQMELEKKYRQQLQLQRAHEEFHRQREIHIMQQQLQLQHQRPAPSAAMTPQYPSQLQHHHHHHHHHHHYHQRPFATTGASLRQLNAHPSTMFTTTTNPPPNDSLTLRSSSSSTSTPAVSNGSSLPSSPPSSSVNLHHHHHRLHLGNNATNSTAVSAGLNLHFPPQRSEWTSVKERERSRLLSNVARVRSTQLPLATAEAAKESLRRLSQRIHQRRTRTRETILYDLHQGVKSVEAQVHKQVEMVLSRLKDTPGSRYAFALTHTLLTQLPQALSNTILPSAISAVADTVVGRTSNPLTTLRGRAGLYEFDEEEEEEDDGEEDEDDELEDDLDESSYQQQMILMRLHQQHDPRVSQQLSNEFGTIALAPLTMSSASTSDCGHGSTSAAEPSSPSPSIVHGHHGSVSISSAGASEFLAASTHHDYSSTASQVLSATLPSFIPSMVAPIICVFSYPTPPNSKTNSPNQSTPSLPSLLTPLQRQGNDNYNGKGVDSSSAPGHSQAGMEERDLQAPIKADTAIAEVTSIAWTSAEQEALFLAAARFKLQGQWSKIGQIMGLRRTDKEIKNEYQRLYGENDDDDQLEEEQVRHDQDMDDIDLVPIKKESEEDDSDLVPIKQESEEDGDADDEAEAGVAYSQRPSAADMAMSSLSPVPQQLQGPTLMDIKPLPTAVSHRRHGHHHRLERHHHHRRFDDKSLLKTLNEKPLRTIKKEFMIDERFRLEEIPMRL